MKKRLDILLADRFRLTRSKAQALIMAGRVVVAGKQGTKAGQEYDQNLNIEIKESLPYVSRGALKLERAAQEFDINFRDKIVADIGASTGGFTDYALQNGAKKVYAIDCGYGQLDQKLRREPRVINMERTNIRGVDSLPEPIDIFVIDVSFISLKKVLPQVLKISPTSHLSTLTCSVVALIKPQFEVGKIIADKYKGVITDEKIRQSVVEDIKIFAQNTGLVVKGITESPIAGAKGNKEFLIYLRCK